MAILALPLSVTESRSLCLQWRYGHWIENKRMDLVTEPNQVKPNRSEEESVCRVRKKKGGGQLHGENIHYVCVNTGSADGGVIGLGTGGDHVKTPLNKHSLCPGFPDPNAGSLLPSCDDSSLVTSDHWGCPRLRQLGY